MSLLTVATGDATRPEGAGPRVIAHVVNDRGGFGRGFAAAVARRWPDAKAAYLAWREDNPHSMPFELGHVQLVRVAPDLYVAHMLAQRGYATRERPCALEYSALGACLRAVQTHARALGASVHMPRIGCGLAGGDWERVKFMVIAVLWSTGVEVTVYNLPRGGVR